MVTQKSIEKINKRMKHFTIKNRKSNANLRIMKDSAVYTVGSTNSNYNLSLNKKLVPFKKTNVEKMKVCNIRKAFRYEEKLKYKLDKCYDYDAPEALLYLLEKLQNNSFRVSQIIAPKQIDGNCWFNAMFMMFFVSDKGRIFFHYFRQLMIQGFVQGKDALIEIKDERLKDAFALLNFIIECCLNGDPLAKTLNTNKIIKRIYDIIVGTGVHYGIPNVGESGNPILYYRTLVHYLGNNELKTAYLNGYNWKKELRMHTAPHVIIIEYHANINKSKRFIHNNHVYELDSAAIIDNEETHFCSLITFNGIEFVFDGYSNSRLIPFQWKDKINKNMDWNFKDNIYEFEDGDIIWNFTKGYCIMCYYRKT